MEVEVVGKVGIVGSAEMDWYFVGEWAVLDLVVVEMKDMRKVGKMKDWKREKKVAWMGKVEKGVEEEETIDEVKYFELKKGEIVEVW